MKRRYESHDDGSPVAATVVPADTTVRQVRWGARLGNKMLQREAQRLQRKERKQEQDLKPLHEQFGLSTPPLHAGAGPGIVVPHHRYNGRALLASFEGAFRYLFEHSEVRLGDKQKRLMDVATVAMLGRIFRHDLVANLKWLRRRFAIEALIDTLAVLFPRRSGKTEAAAMLFAIILVSLPHGNCMLYTLTAAHAREFLDSVWNYLEIFKNSPEYGFEVKNRDLNKYYKIRMRKWPGIVNTVQAFGGAQQGEAKIDCRMGTPVMTAAATAVAAA